MNLQWRSYLNFEKIFGVVGSPIEQSLSPVLHNFGFQFHELPYVYFKWEIPKNKIAELIVSVKVLKIQGLSVTIPLKEAIIPYLDHLTDDARSVGAVNHIFWEGDKLVGNNTDVYGFVKPIKNLPIESAVILGTGGAALSAIVGLSKMDIKEICVVGRNLDRLNMLRERFKVKTLLWENSVDLSADMLVNSTPLGMKGKMENVSPYPVEKLQNFRYIYDMVYNPEETKLIKHAQKYGLNTISGVYMFIYQGLRQFEIWTNKHIDFNTALSLIRKHVH